MCKCFSAEIFAKEIQISLLWIVQLFQVAPLRIFIDINGTIPAENNKKILQQGKNENSMKSWLLFN